MASSVCRGVKLAARHAMAEPHESASRYQTCSKVREDRADAVPIVLAMPFTWSRVQGLGFRIAGFS